MAKNMQQVNKSIRIKVQWLTYVLYYIAGSENTVFEKTVRFWVKYRQIWLAYSKVSEIYEYSLYRLDSDRDRKLQ